MTNTRSWRELITNSSEEIHLWDNCAFLYDRMEYITKELASYFLHALVSKGKQPDK